MNNKRIFSFNLFKQTFNQLKSVGIISIVGTMFFLITSLFSGYESVINENSMGKAKQTAVVISGIDENQFLIIVIPFVVLALGLVTWYFLNKRTASDFYHSLPYTRFALFTSRFMAGFAWLFIIIVLSFLLQIIFYAINYKIYLFDVWGIIIMHLAMLLYGLQALAAIALACAITGNVISNLITSAMIIFLPRFITSIIFTFINSQTILRVNEVPGLFNNRYNLDVGLVFRELGIYNENSLYDIVASNSTFAYTIILTALYFILAIIAFNKRKSEYAGKSAISKTTRVIIRIAIVVAINIYSVANFVNNEYNFDNLWEIVATLLLTVVVLGLYEYVAAKRFDAAFRAIPSLIAGILLTISISFFIDFTIDGINSYAPSEGNVKSVSIYVGSDTYANNIVEYTKDWTKDIKITDEETINILIDDFNKTKVNVANEKTSNYYLTDSGHTALNVVFNSSIVNNKRIVWVSDDDLRKIADKLGTNKEYTEGFYEYPKASKASFELNGNFYLTDSQIKDVYKTAVNELKGLTFTDVFMARVKGSPVYIDTVFSKNGNKFRMCIPLSQEYTPEALNLAMNYNNESLDADENVRKDIVTILNEYKNSTDRSDSSVGEFYYNDANECYEVYFSKQDFHSGTAFDSSEYSLTEINNDNEKIANRIINTIDKGIKIENVDKDDSYLNMLLKHMVYSEEINGYYCDKEYNYYIDMDNDLR